jgi:hypothetical protein
VNVSVQMRREEDVVTTRVGVDAIEVKYARRLRARNNQLLFAAEPGAGGVTVHGFTLPAIQVFEISDPLRPVRIFATVTEQGSSSWRVSWTVNPATPGRYLAAAAYAQPERIEGLNDSGWGGAKAGAPHVVIAPRALAGAANVLVAHRRNQGLHSLLVQVEDLQDVFTHGRPDPRAIPRFLAHARSRWTVKPLYVCLAGDGHLDYRDRFNQAATRPNHIPPLQDRIPFATPSGSTLETTGTDNPLADTDGDGVADVAIGRLPAQNAAALTRMINRIRAHEASDAWKRHVLLVADKDEQDLFLLAGRRTEKQVPAWMTVQRLDHGMSTPVETMRSQFVQSVNAGPLLALYYGHANNIGISSPYFFTHNFTTSNLPLLTNASRTPVLIAGTCMLNNFAKPHPQDRCLGKGFLDTAPGGPVAVWASASESTLAMAESTAGAILKKLAADRQGRLGALIQPALALQAGSASPWTARSSVLLGDPGMRIRTHLVLDRTPPVVRIARPTSSGRFSTAQATLNLSGTASDLNGIARVVVRNDRDRSERAASGTTSWRLDRYPLYHGENRLSVVATDMAGNTATALLRVTHNPVPAVRRKVNVGGRAVAGGWEADAGAATPAGRKRSVANPIARAGSVPQAVYQTWREGRATAHAFSVPDGKYAVRLHFADSISTLAGQRRFHLELEGRRRLTNFDIYRAAGGRQRATTKPSGTCPCATACRSARPLPRARLKSTASSSGRSCRASWSVRVPSPCPKGNASRSPSASASRRAAAR